MAEVITLNVGGIHYTTTTATLLSGSNYFDTLLSGKYSILRDAQGNVFIDRDGSTFRYILNFLRGSSLHVTESNPAKLSLIYQEILDEALFFNLASLSDELEHRILQIEEHENQPKIDNVVTELQRLQRQLKAKPNKTPTSVRHRSRTDEIASGSPMRTIPLQQHHQHQQPSPSSPLFALNISF
jgi:hypothetical protein